MDPPRALLLICAFHRLAGERAPLFSLRPVREHPRSHRPRDSLTFRLAPLPWPCGTAGGSPGTAAAQLPSAGDFWGKTNRPPGMGRGCPGPAAPPAPAPLGLPGSSFANEKAPGKGIEPGTALPARPGEAAPRSPASGRVPGAVNFVPARPRTSAGATRGTAASPPGKGRGSAGRLRSSRAGPGALPLAPAPRPGAGAWVRFIFGVVKFLFFPRRELVGGEEGGGDSCKTT